MSTDWDKLVSNAKSNIVSTEVPKQKTRTFLQGLTFQSADEVEAALRSMFNEKGYEQTLNEIQQSIKDYQGAYPGESLAYEAGGALAPVVAAVAASPFTGGSSGVAATAASRPLISAIAKGLGFKNPSSFLQMLGVGAAQGGVTGYMGSEGDMIDRATGGATGTAIGGATAGAVDVVGKALKPLTLGFYDFLRVKLGNRVGGTVETVIQKNAEDAGLTEDEAVQMVLDGKILADNVTIREMAKGYMRSPQANAVFKTELPARTKTAQVAVGDEAATLLGGAPTENLLKKQFAKFDTMKEEISSLYSKGFAQGAIPDQFRSSLRSILQRSKRATQGFQGFDIIADAREKVKFFSVDKDGVVTIDRMPTIEEAELLRRTIAESVDNLAEKTNFQTASQAVGSVEQDLRKIIDGLSDATKDARAKYSSMMDQDGAFKLGQKIWKTGKLDADLIDIEMDKLELLNSPEALAAFKLGILRKIRPQLQDSPTSYIKKIAEEGRAENVALRRVFGGDKFDEFLKTADFAKLAQETSKELTGGSDSLAKLGASQQQANIIGFNDFNLQGLLQLGMKVLNRNMPGLTEPQKRQVAEILTSQDPAFIRSILNDRSGSRRLQNFLEKTASTMNLGATRGSVYGLTSNPSSTMQGAFDPDARRQSIDDLKFRGGLLTEDLGFIR